MSEVFEAMEKARTRASTAAGMIEFKAREIADKLLAGEQPLEIDLKVYAEFKKDHAEAMAEYAKADEAFTAEVASGLPKEQPPAAQATEDYPNLREVIDQLPSVDVGNLDASSFHAGKHDLDGSVLGRNNFVQDGDFVRQRVVGEGRHREIELGLQPFFNFQMNSFSVGDASVDAVGGTSESTERGHAPGSPGMKVPSAVAAAEGDETNNPEQ